MMGLVCALLAAEPSPADEPWEFDNERAHVVAQGESLQSIATANYGRPGMWRAIADVNGIDDPMRLPPGTKVFLPGPDEIASGR